MFEDGIVRKKKVGFDPETSMYCFGGGGGNDNSTSDSAYSNQQTGQGSKTSQPGENTRIDSRGKVVNFNTTPATVTSTPNYTKTLPNGVVVTDFSRNFGGQVNLSNQGTPLGGAVPPGGMFGNLPNSNVRNPEVLAPVTGTTPINPENFAGQAPLGMDTNFGAFGQQINEFNRATTPTTPAQALQEAISTGRVQLGGGFYAGRTPSGLGLGIERTFAEGGAVNSGIGSLLRSAKS
jgi:hypothetical protein